MAGIPTWHQPSHPELVEVVKSNKSFGSYAFSLVSLPAGSHFASITDYFSIRGRTYATVEASTGQHIDLNSDLFYVNHSCNPSLEFDMAQMEVRVSRFRNLVKGEELTLFYPSTEYEMAQPFDCHCKEAICKGRISGAGDMSFVDLKDYWLNNHVQEQLEKENQKTSLVTKGEQVQQA